MKLTKVTCLYSIWDLFRSQLPFLTITDPTAVEEMIRSLIDTYRHVGWLPDCRMTLSKGYTQVGTPTLSFQPFHSHSHLHVSIQGGSNADVVLADAYIKGLRGGINVRSPFLFS